MSESIFETVIGLEVHIELNTETKIFCSCSTEYGALPNTHVCPVCTGYPGTLPVLNRKAVTLAIRAGTALGCTILPTSGCARKNYFYPDLPKGYQISQADFPVCTGGHVAIDTVSGRKEIGITRIHIEEDAGKLVHNGLGETFIDFNRAGVPLIEIVSAPDISSAAEASAYLKKLRLIMLYAGVSDCKMNEGSMRCDVNISVRRKGDTALGVRTEIKNLNSFAFTEKAIEAETNRQLAAIETGGEITRQTLRFDPASGKVIVMRDKESGEDYRFFPEPDIPMFRITKADIENAAKDLPTLPDEREKLYTEKYGIPHKDAVILISEPAVSLFFDSVIPFTKYKKIAASLILAEFPGFYKAAQKNSHTLAEKLAELCDLLGDKEISSSVAKKVLKLLLSENISPLKYIDEHALRLVRDEAVLKAAVQRAVLENPDMVSDYRSGRTAAIKSIMGICMRLSGGSGDPELLDRLLKEALNKN